MIKVNLLGAPGKVTPRDWLPREQRSAAIGLGLLMVTALGVCGWWYYLHHTRVALDTRVASSEAELARLKEAAKVVADTTARKEELSERLALIDELRTTKRQPVSLLETISQSLPDGLWLSDVKETGPSTQLDGHAMSLTAVTDFAEKLQDSGLFKRPVEILNTTTETIDEANVVKFSLKADTLPPASASTDAVAPGATAPLPAAPAASPGGTPAGAPTATPRAAPATGVTPAPVPAPSVGGAPSPAVGPAAAKAGA